MLLIIQFSTGFNGLNVSAARVWNLQKVSSFVYTELQHVADLFQLGQSGFKNIDGLDDPSRKLQIITIHG